MNIWKNLVKTALLGTQRSSLPTIVAKSPLTTLLAQTDPANSEAALLTMAGTFSLHQQCGRLPEQTIPPAQLPIQEDMRIPSLPPHLTQRLDMILDGHHSVVLPELLAAIHQAGFRIPDVYLPNILDKGMRLVSLRPFIPPILGSKGQRLAARNPNWAYAAIDKDNLHRHMQQWRTTDPGKRHVLLQQIRALNPDGARQLLESTWRSEKDMVRVQLIRVLQINMSMADEPFLETALDDRHMLVRQKAVDLLSYLSQSRYAQRMMAHTRYLLSWTPQRTQKITIRFPKIITDQMARDGILRNANLDLSRLRSRQLIQMITAVPLDHWTTSWHVTPTDIMQAIPTTQWQRTLTTAFTNATIRQQNHAWALALVRLLGIRDQTARLVSTLTAEDYDTLVNEYTKNFAHYPSLEKGSPLRILLQNHPDIWHEKDSTYFLNAIATHMKQAVDSKRPDPSFGITARQFAKSCPPLLANTAAWLLNDKNIIPNWRKTANDMREMIEFRRDMLLELEAMSPTREATKVQTN
jgi:hypothetical protein